MLKLFHAHSLVALSVCNSLPLLGQLFGEVKVPQAVYDEQSKPRARGKALSRNSRCLR